MKKMYYIVIIVLIILFIFVAAPENEEVVEDLHGQAGEVYMPAEQNSIIDDIEEQPIQEVEQNQKIKNEPKINPPFVPPPIEHIEERPEPPQPVSEFQSCGDKMDLLTHSPLDYDDFINIVPLGNLNPSGHTFPTDHIYWRLRPKNTNKPYILSITSPLISPGDGWITEISSSEHLYATPTFTDYSFKLVFCEEFNIEFGHVSSLSEKLEKAFDNAKRNCDKYDTGGGGYANCWTEELTKLKVSAGEVIGTAGGNPDQDALDIWAHDFRITPLNYVNPKRWDEFSLHVVCALDYFVDEEKEKFYDLLGGYSPSADKDKKRTIEPLCGTVEQDIKGTAQGVWFIEGTPQKVSYSEDSHLALVTDNIAPDFNVSSVGTSTEIESDTYLFEPEKTGDVNIAFADVRPGKTYCYEPFKPWEPTKGYGFVILLELLDEETLKIGKNQGKRCKKPYSFDDYVMFER